MKRFVVLALVAATACSNGTPPTAKPATPSPSPIMSSSPSPALRAAPAFDAARAYRTVEALSVRIGPREDSDPRFDAAADLIAASFAGGGYTVSRQAVGLPAGRSAGTSVPEDETHNIIATPPGYDPAAPHLVAGAHLDTVARAPGANDNASGVAVLVELARLARLWPTAMPVVWIAFGGEERRVPGDAGALFGSRAYVSSLSRAEHDSLKGVVIFDVVGRGPEVQAASGGTGSSIVLDAVVAAAAARSIPSRKRVMAKLFSDHRPFERAGFPVAWFYSGEFPQLHTPSDTLSIVQQAALGRAGVVAWDVLRTLRL